MEFPRGMEIMEIPGSGGSKVKPLEWKIQWGTGSNWKIKARRGVYGYLLEPHISHQNRRPQSTWLAWSMTSTNLQACKFKFKSSSTSFLPFLSLNFAILYITVPVPLNSYFIIVSCIFVKRNQSYFIQHNYVNFYLI